MLFNLHDCNFKKKNVLGVAVMCPEFFWAYWYMYWDRDFNKSIGKRTVRQTD